MQLLVIKCRLAGKGRYQCFFQRGAGNFNLSEVRRQLLHGIFNFLSKFLRVYKPRKRCLITGLDNLVIFDIDGQPHPPARLRSDFFHVINSNNNDHGKSVLVRWIVHVKPEENGLGFVVWGPLFGGWLSGRYHRGMSEPPAGRIKEAEKQDWFEKWSRYNTETTWSIINGVTQIAQRLGKSPAQVSLNWLRNKSNVSSIILGASKISHLQDNLGCLSWNLSQEDMGALDGVSDTDKPYPYDFLELAKTV